MLDVPWLFIRHIQGGVLEGKEACHVLPLVEVDVEGVASHRVEPFVRVPRHQHVQHPFFSLRPRKFLTILCSPLMIFLLFTAMVGPSVNLKREQVVIAHLLSRIGSSEESCVQHISTLASPSRNLGLLHWEQLGIDLDS